MKIIFSLLFVISFFLFSCIHNPVPVTIDQFLSEHEAVFRLGTEVAVIEGLKRNPTQESSLISLITILQNFQGTIAEVPSTSLAMSSTSALEISLKQAIYSSVDMTQFDPTEVAFFDALFDEISVQLDLQRQQFCSTNMTAIVCVNNTAWLQTQLPYIHKIAGWLQAGINLYKQSRPAQ